MQAEILWSSQTVYDTGRGAGSEVLLANIRRLVLFHLPDERIFSSIRSRTTRLGQVRRIIAYSCNPPGPSEVVFVQILSQYRLQKHDQSSKTVGVSFLQITFPTTQSVRQWSGLPREQEVHCGWQAVPEVDQPDSACAYQNARKLSKRWPRRPQLL